MYLIPSFILAFSPLTIYKYKKSQVLFLFFFIAVLMIIYAGTRDVTMFPDYENYEDKFRQMDITSGAEPSFYLISYITNLMGGNPVILFLIFAFMGVSLN